MKRVYVLLALALALVGTTLAFSPAALAQSGHFAGKPMCTDEGTFLECTGKVAGSGGTTFRVDVSASGVADVTCTNPGGEVAAGQSFSFEGAGSTGDQLTPRKGKFAFAVSTFVPRAPAGSCPNEMWTATVTDVHFTAANLTLFWEGTVSDTVTVPVS
jgi:hypothetical protein